MRLARWGLLALVASCGCASVAFAPFEAPDPVSLVPAEMPSSALAGMSWGMSPTYSVAPGLVYQSTKAPDTEFTATAFGIKAYSSPIRLDEGPIALQPILQRASWWSIHGGPAHIEVESPAPAEYDGSGFYVEAVVMSPAGFGGRFAYQRLEHEDDDFEWMITSAALLFDYTRGGRIALTFDDDDKDVLILLPIAFNMTRYGIEWTHIFRTPSGVAAMLQASAARSEIQDGNVDDHWTERLTLYFMKEVGFSLVGTHDRGESADADGVGGGIALDMEQVGLFVEYRRNDIHEGGDNEDVLSIRLELRF